MHTPNVRTYPKDAHYRIQDPNSGLYARIKDLPPAQPQLCEESGAVAWRPAHVEFTAAPLSTIFVSHAEALGAHARYMPVAVIEIVRCVP